MIKKIIILFLCFAALNVQSLSVEEKFLSLKKNKVNVRYGPNLDSKIKYIYKKINLPIKQIDKKEKTAFVNDKKIIYLVFVSIVFKHSILKC